MMKPRIFDSMKKIVIIVIGMSLLLSSGIAAGVEPYGKATMRQITQRDSILIADQIEYGFELDSVARGTSIALQDFSEVSNDTLALVRNWVIDTVKIRAPRRRQKDADTLFDVRGTIVLAPFEEGRYELPPILVQRTVGSDVDTLLFEPLEMEVKSMPVDTATFEINDIKGQMRYPLTVKEILPYILGMILIAALAALAIYLIRLRRKRLGMGPKYEEPSYIVALRNLDKYRGEKYWSADKQKIMYSGITDTLRTYIEDRFEVNAEEMTTGEIFDALKKESDLPKDVFEQTKELFELSDFVKFAKHIASDKENAEAIPTAVRFVTSTYQTQQDALAAEDGEEADKK